MIEMEHIEKGSTIVCNCCGDDRKSYLERIIFSESFYSNNSISIVLCKQCRHELRNLLDRKFHKEKIEAQNKIIRKLPM